MRTEQVEDEDSFHSVVGGMDMLQHTVDRFLIGEIIIAIPSASEQNILDIINQQRNWLSAAAVAGVYKFSMARFSIKQIQDVKLRICWAVPVTLDTENISAYISGKVVLVTGAGGSIGSELCRQISEYGLISHHVGYMKTICENCSWSWREISRISPGKCSSAVSGMRRN